MKDPVRILPRRRFLSGAAALALLPPAARAAIGVYNETDVPYVQTPANVVEAMLRIASVGKGDTLIDLGSGDGRIVITAAQRFGTRGLGVEIDPRLVALSRENARKAGVGSLCEFRAEDLNTTDLSGASVVTMYLLPDVNLLLRPKLLEVLRPGSRVVSHDWDMGDWRPDEFVVVDAPEKKIGLAKTSKVMMWIIPARAEGRWRWRQVSDRDGDHEVEVLMPVTQYYQQVGGDLILGTVRYPIDSGALRGERIELSARLPFGAATRRWSFRGTVRGDRISGQAQPEGGAPIPWTARRDAPPPEPRGPRGA